MNTNSLLFGLIGFFLGGLIVSIAATYQTDDAGGASAHSVRSLAQKKGDDFDKTFIDEMIKHHEGAIDMAKLAESNAKHQELKNLSKDILAAQSKEIDTMQTWQADWGYKKTPQSHNSH